MNFDNIEYKTIKYLYDLCKESKENEHDFIHYLYNNSFSNFEKTLFICKLLGLIKENKNKLFCVDGGIPFNQFLIQRMILNRFSLGTLTDFLSNFAFENGEYIFRISNQEKILFMWERNFLSDLGIINFKNNIIVFNKIYSNLLPNRKLSLKCLKRMLQEKEKIGATAEQFVVDYEMRSLINYPFLPNDCVRQISVDFANAGYDIESFDKDEASKNVYKKIFIEVKCVNKDYMFYWSRNEIKRAEELKEKYFLYLVSNTFSDAELKIIKDPFGSLFKSKEWRYEIEQLRVWENNFE